MSARPLSARAFHFIVWPTFLLLLGLLLVAVWQVRLVDAFAQRLIADLDSLQRDVDELGESVPTAGGCEPPTCLEFPLPPDAAPGSYDLVLTLPDGSFVTLQSALPVVDDEGGSP